MPPQKSSLVEPSDIGPHEVIFASHLILYGLKKVIIIIFLHSIHTKLIHNVFALLSYKPLKHIISMSSEFIFH
jgi:hypothetical protein